MLIDNLSTILLMMQTLVIMAGVYIFFINMKDTKPKQPTVIIESLPDLTKGFGFIKGKSLVLNEKGQPYIYSTYKEAKRKMHKVEGVDRIVFQQWDAATQEVLVAEVKSGPDKRQES